MRYGLSYLLRPGRRWFLLAALLLLISGGVFVSARDAARPPEYTPPYAYMHPLWSEVLSAPEGLSVEAARSLQASPAVSLEDAPALNALAPGVLSADLTGVGRSAWPSYWPPVRSSSPPVCSSVEVLASSPAYLLDEEYAKVFVLYHGECEGDEHDHSEEGDEPVLGAFVYAHLSDTWLPVREWDIPRSGEEIRFAALPLPGELKEISSCAGKPTGERARLVVAEAWRQLCVDVAAAGYEVSVSSGFRTPSEQERLHDRAERESGSSQKVAYADGTTCDSKHCDGTALDLLGPEGVLWLNEVVGCISGGEIVLDPSSCSGKEVVKRVNRYGFVVPDPGNPAHVEFALPTGAQKVANCAPSRSIPVPEMVAQIFRCRLERERLDPETITTTTAEALVVSRCESLWNARALALDGRFRSSPHPVTGELVTESGVFMLGDPLGEWAPSREERLDPVLNINAAASIWIAARDWSHWPCATGRPSAYASGPVLSQYGGPELPEWSLQY